MGACGTAAAESTARVAQAREFRMLALTSVCSVVAASRRVQSLGKEEIMTVRVVLALAVLGIAGLLFSGCEPAVPEKYIHVTVEDIVENPNRYVGDFVCFDASVSSLNKYPDGNFYYIAEGEYGKVLNVNTTRHPETKLKYRIWGGVQMAADSYLPVLVEADREAWVPLYQNPVIIGVLIAVVVAVVILLTVQLTRRQPDTTRPPGPDPYGADEWEKPSVPFTDNDVDDDATVVQKHPPDDVSGTMTWMNGRLVVLNGPDEGKELNMPGYPMREGAVMTIGRKNVTGARRWAHIKVHTDIKTVSRMQAEIWYIAGRTIIKNLAEPNPTRLNGETLMVGQREELNYGDVISMGELELRYVEPSHKQ